MQSKISVWVWALPLLCLASGCGIMGGARAEAQGTSQAPPALPPETPADIPSSAGRPSATSAQAGYDDVGYASWYGEEFSGRITAGGEPFNPQAISAAHPSLPIPSYAEVTNLETGRTILVRISDRGPSAKNRLIDLSQAAAAQLGVEAKGVFPVRVRRTNPPEFERTALRLGQTAGERIPTPPALLAALRKKLAGTAVSTEVAIVTQPSKPAKPTTRPAKPRPGAVFEETPAPVAPAANGDRFVSEEQGSRRAANSSAPQERLTGTPYFIQIAAFSNEARAIALAKKAGARVATAGSIYRVRMGPYASDAQARAALGAITARGYRDAKVSR